MGRDKASLPFRGSTLLEWQADKLRRLGVRDLMLSGCRRDLPGARLIPDELPGRGPLSGMHACFQRAAHPHCLVLSVDAPWCPPGRCWPWPGLTGVPRRRPPSWPWGASGSR